MKVRGTITISAECRDKDGNLKWTDEVNIPPPEIKPVLVKEKKDGGDTYD